MNDYDSVPPYPTSLCKRYQRQLALLRTDALLPDVAATLTEHLSDCLWCRQEVAAYDALDADVRRQLSRATFTPLTLEDIMQAPEIATPIPVSNVVRRTVGLSPYRRAAVSPLGSLAAVITLTLLAGLLFMTHRPGVTLSSGTPGPTLGGTPTATSTAALAQPTWRLTDLIADGREQPLVPSRAPWLRFGPLDSGKGSGPFYGSGGCNGVGGSYTLAGDSLHISAASTTQMACLPDGVNAQESAYLRALLRIERFHLDSSMLTLTSGDGSTRLTFQAT